MIHTILYYGRFDLNFERLHSTKEKFTVMRPDNKGFWNVESPSDKVDGIVFGYMEKSKQGLENRFFAVKIEDIILGNPVQLVPDSHTDGKGFGPKPSQFGDLSAMQLLRDIIAQNPDQKINLQEIYNRYFGPYREPTEKTNG
jgi:hypothetical protein